MSSPGRVLAILQLFSKDRPVWNPDQINELLGYTRTTGYRYVKELVDAGFLKKISTGLYSLGPRIIELDYQLRESDPLLLAAKPILEEISLETGYNSVISELFLNSMQIIDTYRASPQTGLELTYGRGRPRPFLISAAPKILLSGLKSNQLKGVFTHYKEQIKDSEMGPSWEDFRAYLKDVKKRGYYCSYGELEAKIGAVAVPIFNRDGDTAAAFALVGNVNKIRTEKPDVLAKKMQAASQKITQRIKISTDIYETTTDI